MQNEFNGITLCDLLPTVIRISRFIGFLKVFFEDALALVVCYPKLRYVVLRCGMI